MFDKITERSSLYDNLEKKSVRELLEDINREDCKVPLAVAKTIPQIEQFVIAAVDRLRKGGRLFYLGAGTSGRLGVLDASELPPTFGVPPTLVEGFIAGGEAALRSAVEHAEDDEEAGWHTLLNEHVSNADIILGIAASGTTPYVLGALQHCRENEIFTGCITSNPDSPVTQIANVSMVTLVGPEFVTGSSRMKSGTAQKLVLNMISTAVMIRLGRVRGNQMVNMQLTNQKLIDRGTHILMERLSLPYERAHLLLITYGSVEKALECSQRLPVQ